MDDHPQISLIESQIAREHERSFTVTQLDDWNEGTPEFDIWRPDDEKEYRQRIASLNGRRIRLLVPHPFAEKLWQVIAPAREPGWFICRAHERYDCNGVGYLAYFPQAFERNEFEVIE